MTGEARVEDYLALLKPSVMQLVVFTAIVGLVVAPGTINPVIGIIAVLIAILLPALQRASGRPGLAHLHHLRAASVAHAPRRHGRHDVAPPPRL